jgi:nucleotide-binding universal stress UspA family protein
MELVVGQFHSIKGRKVVIPIDGSLYSEISINWACNNLIRKDDLIVLVNVYQDRIDSVQLLQECARKLIEHGVHVCAFAVPGNPVVDLANICNSLDPDFILICNRGRGGSCSKAKLGSVAKSLLSSLPSVLMYTV